MPTPAPVRSTLPDALREGTRAQHDALEALGASRELVSGTLSPDGYRRIVAWQRAAHAALEPTLAAAPWRPAYRYLPRVAALAAERVDAPGNIPPSAADAAAGRSAPTLAHATGLAYVLEGSSLGGSVILRHLRASPQLVGFAPFPFYDFQRAEGLAQWRRFVAFAKAHPWSAAEVEEARAAAVGGFEVFAQAWRATVG